MQNDIFSLYLSHWELIRIKAEPRHAGYASLPFPLGIDTKIIRSKRNVIYFRFTFPIGNN